VHNTMQTLMTSLSEPFRSHLAQIRSSIEGLEALVLSSGEDAVRRAIPEAEYALSMLEGWLLDDEQKQLLGLNPWDVFFLYAGAYLWEFSAVGGARALLATDLNSVDRHIDPGTENSDPRPFLLAQWKALGVPDRAVADAIADICRGAGWDQDITGSTPDEIEHVFDGMVVNRPLLSAGIPKGPVQRPRSAIFFRTPLFQVTPMMPPSASWR